jgi:hypothetical protein
MSTVLLMDSDQEWRLLAWCFYGDGRDVFIVGLSKEFDTITPAELEGSP